MAATRDEVVEYFKTAPALEISELTKELEELWGVSAAAPVAIAAAPGGGDGAAAAEEEQTEFTVMLQEIGPNKINVIKAVRELTNLGLREAKELVESAPKAVRENVTKDDAQETGKKLEDAGATVAIS